MKKLFFCLLLSIISYRALATDDPSCANSAASFPALHKRPQGLTEKALQYTSESEQILWALEKWEKPFIISVTDDKGRVSLGTMKYLEVSKEIQITPKKTSTAKNPDTIPLDNINWDAVRIIPNDLGAMDKDQLIELSKIFELHFKIDSGLAIEGVPVSSASNSQKPDFLEFVKYDKYVEFISSISININAINWQTLKLRPIAPNRPWTKILPQISDLPPGDLLSLSLKTKERLIGKIFRMNGPTSFEFEIYKDGVLQGYRTLFFDDIDWASIVLLEQSKWA